MNTLHGYFKKDQDLLHLTEVSNVLIDHENSVLRVLEYSLGQRISLHCVSAAYYYWVDMTTKNLPANLIQAQRDYFGAHTYQRMDGSTEEYFHTIW